MESKKIQLIIRDTGIASRRGAEEIVRAGRVTVNGAIVTDPAHTANPARDHIKLDGRLIRAEERERVYLLFNKPRNVVSTFSDPEGRPCLGDLLKRLKSGLFVVGRLDFDAEGLMILTNDGNFAQRLSHPSNQVPRTYMVKVQGAPNEKEMGRIKKGMGIGNRERVGRIQWHIIKSQRSSAWIKIVLYEGKKNEIKRIFDRIRHPVRKIRRIGFGPFRLGKLVTGAWRPLNDKETVELTALLK